MLPFLVRPCRPKRVRSHRNTVSSQRVNMDDLSGGSFVKRHVGGLRGPGVMQQDRQLAGYSDDSPVPGLLAAS
jgi:hypothetical protein